MANYIKNERWVYVIEGENGNSARVKDLLLMGYDHFSKAMPLTNHVHEDAYEFVYVDQGLSTGRSETKHTIRMPSKLYIQVRGAAPCQI